MKRAWQGLTIRAAANAGIIAALPGASRNMAVSIANEAERETLVAECAIVGVLVDRSLPLVELRERRDTALRGEK